MQAGHGHPRVSYVCRVARTLILVAVALGPGVDSQRTSRAQGISELRSASRRHLSQNTTTSTESVTRPMAGPRIFMGEPAKLGEFPYLVSLRRFGTHFCGGVLIQPNIVLTAAHCVDERRPQVVSHPDVKVGLLGIDDTPETREGVEEFEVCATILHKEFDFTRLQDGRDIALLVLNGASKAPPVGLPRDLQVPLGTKVTAAGFGRLSTSAQATVLQKTDKLEYISNEQCADAWDGLDTIGSNLMCALDPEGSDVCQGDSGGPLVTGDRSMVLGVVSFGPRDCTSKAVPSVYTRVSDFVAFIDELGGENGMRIDNPDCEALPAPIVEPSPAPSTVSSPSLPGVTTSTNVPQAPEGTQEEPSEAETVPDAPSSPPAVESIVSKTVAGDISGASQEIAQAVRDGNTDAVLEAVRQAVQQGARDNAGQALLGALRLGVSAPELLPAFNIVSP